MRSRQRGRRSERGSICLDCFEHRTRGDVVVGGERQPPPPGNLGTVTAAAAEDPDVELGALTGDDVRFGAGGVSIGSADQREHIVDLLGVLGRLRIRLLQEPELEGEARRAGEVGERVRRRDQQAVVGAPTARCGRRRRGGAGWWVGGGGPLLQPSEARPAESEIDPPGMDGVEDAELLDDGERRVVSHQDRARTDPQRAGRVGDQRDQQGGRGAGDARIEMVLGEPVALVPGGLGSLRELDRVGDRLAGGRPARNRNEIEDGQRDRLANGVAGHGVPVLMGAKRPIENESIGRVVRPVNASSASSGPIAVVYLKP